MVSGARALLSRLSFHGKSLLIHVFYKRRVVEEQVERGSLKRNERRFRLRVRQYNFVRSFPGFASQFF
jgi:hypothetical protein